MGTKTGRVEAIIEEMATYLRQKGTSLPRDITVAIMDKVPAPKGDGISRFAGPYNVIRHVVAASRLQSHLFGKVHRATHTRYGLTSGGARLFDHDKASFLSIAASDYRKYADAAKRDKVVRCNTCDTLVQLGLAMAGTEGHRLKLRAFLGRNPDKHHAESIRKAVWACHQLFRRVRHGVFELTSDGLALAVDQDSSKFGAKVASILAQAPKTVLPPPLPSKVLVIPKMATIISGDATHVASEIDRLFRGRTIAAIITGPSEP